MRHRNYLIGHCLYRADNSLMPRLRSERERDAMPLYLVVQEPKRKHRADYHVTAVVIEASTERMAVQVTRAITSGPMFKAARAYEIKPGLVVLA